MMGRWRGDGGEMEGEMEASLTSSSIGSSRSLESSTPVVQKRSLVASDCFDSSRTWYPTIEPRCVSVSVRRCVSVSVRCVRLRFQPHRVAHCAARGEGTGKVQGRYREGTGKVSHRVAHCATRAAATLRGHALGQRDGRDAPRLRQEDAAFSTRPRAYGLLQQILRHLRRFATAGLARHHQHARPTECTYDKVPAVISKSRRDTM